MNTLTDSTRQGQTPEAEARTLVLAMEMEAVTTIGTSGTCGAVVQNWVNDVFVVLTLTTLRCGVWMVGIPTQGVSMTVTDDVEAVVAMIAGYIAEVPQVEAAEEMAVLS